MPVLAVSQWYAFFICMFVFACSLGLARVVEKAARSCLLAYIFMMTSSESTSYARISCACISVSLVCWHSQL